jgi:Na+-transporting methylmalonyl-CoA/oxaloacetate decarboxylase gamma subunit
MKGGIILGLGVVLILIVVLALIAVVTCTSPVNNTAFFCEPLKPFTDLVQQFF